MSSKLHPLLELIEDGESISLDFKYNINDSKKIARSLVAFANTQGGRLLIGVRDNGSIAGVHTDEEIYMLESAAQMYSKPAIPLDIKTWQIEDKAVLEVQIAESANKPHFAPNDKDKWLAYIRIADNNFVANPVWLKVWKYQKSAKDLHLNFTQRESAILAFLKTHEKATIRQIRKELKLSHFSCQNILAKLIHFEAVQIEQTPDDTFFSLVS